LLTTGGSYLFARPTRQIATHKRSSRNLSNEADRVDE
jgi:hypothetical protein